MLDLSFTQFNSDNHIRYENGYVIVNDNTDAFGNNFNPLRTILIEKESNYQLVTIFNNSSFHPLWLNEIQMAPKRMVVKEISNNLIVLRGFGNFIDYGLSIHLSSTNIDKVVLYIYDRNIEIHYYNKKENQSLFSKYKQNAIGGIYYCMNDTNLFKKRYHLIELFNEFLTEINTLKKIKDEDYKLFAEAFCHIIKNDLMETPGNREFVGGLAYFFISKIFEFQGCSINLLEDRIYILNKYIKDFHKIYCNSENIWFSGSYGSHLILNSPGEFVPKMILFDIVQLSKLTTISEAHEQSMNNIIKKYPNFTADEIFKKGEKIHADLIKYLYKSIIKEENIDF